MIRRAEESRQPFESEVALFVDDSAESERARRAFEEAQISFRTLSATGPDIPAAVFGGMRFVGQANIVELIRTLKAIEDVLVSNLQHTMPQLVNTDKGQIKRRIRSDAQPLSANRAKTA